MDMIKTYTEVFEVLNLLGNEYIQKIPNKLYMYIAENRDKKSIIEYDINTNILDQNISEDAKDMIAYLNLQYWCTPEEKERLLKQYEKNDKLYEEKLKEKYSYDNLFKKTNQNIEVIRNNDDESKKLEKSKALIEYKESMFKKIISKIKHFFHLY